jgi:hypothetical protein
MDESINLENIIENINKIDINKKISCFSFNESEKISIPQYPNKNLLIDICESFKEEIIKFQVIFKNHTIYFCNCNAIGNILESIFFSIDMFIINSLFNCLL